MTINPVVLIFILYLFANITALIQGINDGGMLLDGSFFELKSLSLVVSFIAIFCVLCFLFFVFCFFSKKSNGNKFYFKNGYGISLIIIQLSFMIFNSVMGVNVAGVDTRPENGSLLNYIFILLQPDILFLLTALFVVSERIFWANLLIFLFSMFLRGWMSGVFLVLNIVMIRYYPIRLSVRTLIKLIFSILLLIILLPVIVDAKWAMRLGMPISDFINMLPQSFTAEKYSDAMKYVVNRFQHVGHVAFLFEKSEQVYADFNKGIFISYWMDGLPQHTIAKLFSLETYKLNSYMVSYLYDLPEATWNTNPGVAGWFFILQEKFVLMLFYLLFVVVIPFWFVKKYAGNRMLMLMAFFSLIYLFHGWVGAYFNIVFYAILVIIVSRSKFQCTKKFWSQRIR